MYMSTHTTHTFVPEALRLYATVVMILTVKVMAYTALAYTRIRLVSMTHLISKVTPTNHIDYSCHI